MGSQGYAFRFVVTLNALHYLTTTVWTVVAKKVGLAKQDDGAGGKPAHVPWKAVAVFTLVSDASIISLNTSLMLNSITLYQIAKLGIIPCTCVVEYFLYGRVFTAKMIASIGLTLCGVALVAITEMNVSSSALGVAVAACSVLSSSGQQLLGMSLLLLSPVLDKLSTGIFVTDYRWSRGSALCLVMSCSAAVLVNVSQFLVLGRFTAVTYQVLGHAKTICVLVVGYLFFGGQITGQQFVGMTMAVGGMMSYSQASQNAPQKPASAPKASESDLTDLLGKNKESNAV
ncbi:hypothetical protein JL722_13322 [Aureococcus anophagefferens]|nr:hypothetical protein JL722_13322 [Aureococcus anophagefferens]